MVFPRYRVGVPALGWSSGVSAPLAAVLVVLWVAAIYVNSSALTAGTVQAAKKKLLGATIGLHSICACPPPSPRV
jgi:hypothetical protein